MVSRINFGEIEALSSSLDGNTGRIECWDRDFFQKSEFQMLLSSVRHSLAAEGFVIAGGFHLPLLRGHVRKKLYLSLCSLLWRPTEHNVGKFDYVWEIQSKTTKSSLPTFSENNLEASLHTDAQYREEPEKYASLFMVRQSKCGGGKTKILRFSDIIKTLAESNDGRKCLKLLKEAVFPFAVPTVFCERRREVIYTSIIDDDMNVRYRYDTIIAGLACCQKEIEASQEQIWAFNFFDTHIKTHPCLVTTLLQDGEILFVDNYKVLHGRTSFKDLNRYALRIRMASR